MMPVSVNVPVKPESGSPGVLIECAESDSSTKPSTNAERNDVDYAGNLVYDVAKQNRTDSPSISRSAPGKAASSRPCVAGSAASRAAFRAAFRSPSMSVFSCGLAA